MGQGKATDEQLAKIEEYRNSYVDMVGFVPPRIASRIARLTELNPDFLIAQEEVRRQAVYTDALDQKTVQLILFAVLAVNVRDAAKLHGLAALRAGATWEELQATLNLAFLFGGLSVSNRNATILDEIAELEESQQNSQ
ncbi:carboxymuconolactone decarboxylase [Mycolicibacterium canariasense]|uniref:Carboxymuconolactone decarboxylase n=1 Tax=Mycolicibacterium canariasense TaxID=228230 RepID=A0A100WJ40_MYCCR|nr:carboxymuconolactone decarboxylase family protein [Mycolicibacterium canariasense]MCV7207256.1 carboxymuconolactone decarboxylase family protein [Mycolicibacterium canariasense]ORV06516.1 carboxymuconolactone decarboxylase [Mycolicibacterium canariasense]GAS99487.1 carboxymuconolactone decarboxylase [Mycolicibacterium canariasense]